MRKVFYVFTLTVLFAAKANSQSLSQQVVGAAGNFSVANGNSLSFTVGEAAVQTLTNSNILTQGFQQPEKLVVSGVTITNSFFQLDVYPNPTQDNLFVKLHASSPVTAVTVRLMDMLGRNLFESANSFAENTLITVPMKNFPAGTYLLTVADDKGNVSSYKVINLR